MVHLSTPARQEEGLTGLLRNLRFVGLRRVTRLHLHDTREPLDPPWNKVPTGCCLFVLAGEKPSGSLTERELSSVAVEKATVDLV